jgi:exopolysaccharide biosynthesis polyprenyl glycosylphosphotransferase
MLYLERKRTERSGRSFVLMLLESTHLLKADSGENTFDRVLAALRHSTRDTDITGWYKDESTIGVIFTELGAVADAHDVASALQKKITAALSIVLSTEQINDIRLTVRTFPDDWGGKGPRSPDDLVFYPERSSRKYPRNTGRVLKRMMDLSGSLFALIFTAPLFALIAIAIKATSRGPVLFRQERVGLHGRKFTFLKFRSMYSQSSHAIHEEYVKQFISGSAASKQNSAKNNCVYKLVSDPRVTRIGAFLRRSSLDELPQLINVLRGEMSLVGPRPPIPYEVDRYDVWHRMRFLTVKPGLTGLWQVKGRSRTTFDEMVRLDLRYATSWSLWLDLSILIQTPFAVLRGDGAC